MATWKTPIVKCASRDAKPRVSSSPRRKTDTRNRDAKPRVETTRCVDVIPRRDAMLASPRSRDAKTRNETAKPRVETTRCVDVILRRDAMLASPRSREAKQRSETKQRREASRLYERSNKGDLMICLLKPS
ncbi:MAG TPA: hypothetical protein EYP59_15665 [Thiotrichaceae bacterium]|nr:hypothetical protein [Thiotrichaceae bacterium]